MRSTLYILFFTFSVHASAQQSDFASVDFSKADHIATVLEGEELINLPILTHRLTAQMPTDVERFRAIYYWVTHNIKGEYDMTRKSNHARKKYRNDPEALQQWNRTYRKEVFIKLLNDKETLCTGYAYLIKKMALLAGLECEIVNGYDPTNTFKSKNGPLANHAWNAIKIDGKWYLCDATWSSGYTDMGTYLFEYDYDDTYFLMKPSEFAKTHKPEDPQWNLLTRKDF